MGENRDRPTADSGTGKSAQPTPANLRKRYETPTLVKRAALTKIVATAVGSPHNGILLNS